jgi:hypothetical protein
MLAIQTETRFVPGYQRTKSVENHMYGKAYRELRPGPSEHAAQSL